MDAGAAANSKCANIGSPRPVDGTSPRAHKLPTHARGRRSQRNREKTVREGLLAVGEPFASVARTMRRCVFAAVFRNLREVRERRVAVNWLFVSGQWLRGDCC